MSFNIHGLVNKVLFPDFFKFVKSADVFVLLETWVEEKDCGNYEKYFGGFNVYFYGAKKEDNRKGRASGGMIIGIKKDISCKIFKRTVGNFHVFKLTFDNMSESYLNIIPVYLTPSNWANECNELNNFLESLDLNRVVLVGDLNARTGCLQTIDDCVFSSAANVFEERNSEDPLVNTQGRKILSVFEDYNLVILNGRTTGDTFGRATYRGSKSIVDYGVVSAELVNSVNSLCVLEVDFSDHFAIELKIGLNLVGEPIDSNNSSQIRKSFRWDKKRVSLYKCELDMKLGVNDMEQMKLDELKQTICEIGSNLMKIRNPSFKEKWFDFHCWKKRKESFKMFNDYRKYRGSCTLLRQILYNRYWFSNQEYKDLCEKKRLEFYEKIGKELNNIKSTRDWWKWAGYFRTVGKSSNNGIENSVLADFFQTSLNKVNVNPILFCEPNYVDPILDALITKDEIRNSLSSLKEGKAVGQDGISMEFYMFGTDKLMDVLQSNFNSVTSQNVLSNKSIITALHKKGDKSIPGNYRGISVGDSSDKLFGKVLYDRLEKWVDEKKLLCEFQSGFRKGYSTFDNIFNLFQIVKLSWKRGLKKVFCFFVDFKAAFDGVIRSALFYKLFQLGISTKFIDCVRSLYENTLNSVRTGNEYSSWFESTAGVRQGCILSPLLFSLFINDLHTVLGGGVRVGETRINILMYADDIVLMSENPTQLQMMINKLENYCKTWQLEVNLSKSQIMIMKEGGGPMCSNEKWTYGATRIQTVREYRYLGLILTPSLNMKKNFDEKVSSGKFKIHSVWKEFIANKMISLKDKISLFNAVARSGVCYASQVVGFKNYDEINILQRQFVKKVLGLPTSTPNHVLTVECGVKDVYNFTLETHMRYIHKVLSKYEDHRLPKRLAIIGIEKKVDWWVKWLDLGQLAGVTWSFEDGYNSWSKNIKSVITYIENSEMMSSISLSRRTEGVFGRLSYMNGNGFFNLQFSIPEVSLLVKVRANLLPLNDKPWRQLNRRKCSLCNSQEKECVFHFVAVCRMLSDIRLRCLGSRCINRDDFISLLEGSNWNKLLQYLKEASQERNDLINIFNV